MKEAMKLPNDEKLIAIAYLAGSSVLHIRERYKEGELIKYSYHLMKGDKVIRWDNVPHHRAISTYPHHKHENDEIMESRIMDVGTVLEEIETIGGM